MSPMKSPRPCRAPMCSGKTTAKHGYCDQHAHLAVTWDRRKPGTQSGRGGRPWRRQREGILKRDKGLCQPCWRAGRVTPATEVDHIVNLAAGGDGRDANLEAICGLCHREKTLAEARQGRDGED